jgi:hypothetical protein
MSARWCASLSAGVSVLLIAAVPTAALAGTLLHTAAGAQNEAAIIALVGKPSGATLTAAGKGGSCVYTGRASYRVDELGELSIEVEEDCAAITNLGTLPVCALSSELECTPGGHFQHHYRIIGAGLMVDSRLIAWLPSPAPSLPDLLQALRVRIAAAQELARAAHQPADVGSNGLVIRCRSPRSSFMIRSNLSNLMFRQQRADPYGLCAERVLDQFLAAASQGDPVNADSPLGRCLQAAGVVSDWTTTRCAVADH